MLKFADHMTNIILRQGDRMPVITGGVLLNTKACNNCLMPYNERASASSKLYSVVCGCALCVGYVL